MDGAAPMPDDVGAPADALDPENAAVEANDNAEPVATWSSWRAKRAFRQAVAEAAEDDLAFDDLEAATDDDVAIYAAAGAAVAPAMLTKPVRSTFRRAARLLRKYGAE